MEIIKRNGDLVEYNGLKIINAIKPAMVEARKGNVVQFINEQLIKDIEQEVYNEILLLQELQGRNATVEEIQDIVEDRLMSNGEHKTAKRYILYRKERSEIRDNWRPYKKFKYLSDEFLKQYAGNPDPFESQLSKVTFYRTYSRYIPELKRRETWLETNARVADFIVGLDSHGTVEKAEELFESLFNFEVMSSGRVRWLGGTKLAEQNFQSLFNCAYITLDNEFNIIDLMYNLMLGAGVGARMTFDDIAKIAPFRNDIEVINKRYEPIAKNKRQELTTTKLHNNSILEIVVGDSRRGWTDALRIYLEFITNYKNSSNNNIITTILFNYDNVRPQGEKLKTIGGYASGHEVLADLFEKINNIIKNSDGEQLTRDRVKIEPVDMLDIVTKIADIVRVGGTRRSAILLMVDKDDQKSIDAKKKLYKQVNGKYQIDGDIAHRQMSNNSVAYYSKPNRNELHEAIERLKISAEPSFINMEEMQRRKPNAQGLNPCVEIIMTGSYAHCNLTAVNMVKFVDSEGNINWDKMERTQELATYMGYIISEQELDLFDWDKQNKDDKIIGITLNGLQDYFNSYNATIEEQIQTMKFMKKVAHSMNEELALEYDSEVATAVTTSQPNGTGSILVGNTSSGIHWQHSEFYARRIRISKGDAVAKSLIESGFNWYPEVGQTRENHSTKVFEFPVKAVKGKTKYDITAIEQLEMYKRMMTYYVDHNVSITVSVKDNEWSHVEQWLWDNWDSYVGISFISLDDSFYELLPYEAITEDEYNIMKKKMPEFNVSTVSKYESGDDFDTDDMSDCSGGACAIK